MEKFYTKNEKQTIKLGKKLAGRFYAGLVIVLKGDLGAGKTTITKGFAKGLKIKSAITSPTFTIMNEYEGKLPLYHFDMYRLEDSDEAYEFGMQEYLNDSENSSLKKGVVVIEWADRIKNMLPQHYLLVEIKKQDQQKREIIVRQV